jgi:ubiquinone/menaquinone biosynthesis C-methylase UbiE
MASATDQHPDLPLPDYFSKFAANYVRQTGQSTLNILRNIVTDQIQKSCHPIGPDSVIHDTAAGPGIAAAALVARLHEDQLPKEMLVSDIVPVMVMAANESLVNSPLRKVECKELDSQDLKGVRNDYFTHSIDNFSIFTFVRPVDAIRETYRTLRPGGLAVVTCWRRFAPMHIVHATQRKIQPDLPGGFMPTPSPEFYEEGVLQRVVEQGGFHGPKIDMFDQELVVADEKQIAGLTELMSGPMMAKAREGYTPEQEARWAETVKESVQEEIAQYGGIRFEAYVLLATK